MVLSRTGLYVLFIAYHLVSVIVHFSETLACDDIRHLD